jgi:hypothetical protein
MKIDRTSPLVSIGAITGIYYGVSKGKGFWGTAAFVVLFAIGGAALAEAYKYINPED